MTKLTKEQRRRAAIQAAKWNQDHPERMAKNTLAYMIRRRAFMDELKSKPCYDCGNTFPPFVMDFDHRDPTTKTKMPSAMYRGSMKRLLEEVKKCDVICANCHRIRTHHQGF